MPKRKPTVITASSLSCLFSCARKYYLSYELGYRKRIPDAALRFGTAFHKGLEVWFENAGIGQVERATTAFKAALATAGDEEFDAETSQQIVALLTGYFAKWGSAKFTVEPEREFAVRFPFLRGFVVCGKMDGIVTAEDGTKSLIEHKTTSEDISPLGDYWATINRDQIGIYKAAAEKIGVKFSSVIYDVIRKPTIKCGKDETAEEYGARLAADCVGEQVGDNPRAKGYKRGSDFYFARRDIAVLDCDMDVLALRLYAASKMLATYRRMAKTFEKEGAKAIEAYPKCGSTMVCRFCPFRGVCSTDELPEEAWERGRAHEELEIAKNFR